MVLSDVRKLRFDEILQELRNLLRRHGKDRNDWNRIYELIDELERRGESCQQNSE